MSEANSLNNGDSHSYINQSGAVVQNYGQIAYHFYGGTAQNHGPSAYQNHGGATQHYGQPAYPDYGQPAYQDYDESQFDEPDSQLGEPDSQFGEPRSEFGESVSQFGNPYQHHGQRTYQNGGGYSQQNIVFNYQHGDSSAQNSGAYGPQGQHAHPYGGSTSQNAGPTYQPNTQPSYQLNTQPVHQQYGQHSHQYGGATSQNAVPSYQLNTQHIYQQFGQPAYPWAPPQNNNANGAPHGFRLTPYPHLVNAYEPVPRYLAPTPTPVGETTYQLGPHMDTVPAEQMDQYANHDQYMRFGNPMMGRAQFPLFQQAQMHALQHGLPPVKLERLRAHSQDQHGHLPHCPHGGHHGQIDENTPPQVRATTPADVFATDDDESALDVPQTPVPRSHLTDMTERVSGVSERLGNLEQKLLSLRQKANNSRGTSEIGQNKFFDSTQFQQMPFQFQTTLPSAADAAAIGAKPETMEKLEKLVQFWVLPKTYGHGVSKGIMKSFLDTLEPNQVAVVFDRGSRAAKVDLTLLCSKSDYFAGAFNPSHNFEEAQTRCIRLRDDAPCGVKAMLGWVVDGKYSIDYETGLGNPNLTTFDLHIHAYIVADKYQVTKLADHAVGMYLFLASNILSAELPSDLPNLSTGPVQQFPRHITVPPHKNDESILAQLDRFLDSIVLMWKLTQDNDKFRKAVLEAIKPCLHKLIRFRMFGTMVAEMPDFCRDLSSSLEEDGLRLDACPRTKGLSVMSFHK